MAKVKKENTSVNSEVLEKKAVVFFKENTTDKIVFGTADGFLFRNEKNAINHAVSLETKTLEIFKNPNLMDVSEDEDLGAGE